MSVPCLQRPGVNICQRSGYGARSECEECEEAGRKVADLHDEELRAEDWLSEDSDCAICEKQI